MQKKSFAEQLGEIKPQVQQTNNEPESLQELFGEIDESRESSSSETEEQIKAYMKTLMRSNPRSSRLQKFERVSEAGVNAGMILCMATLVISAVAMIAKTCSNKDKGDKFVL